MKRARWWRALALAGLMGMFTGGTAQAGCGPFSMLCDGASDLAGGVLGTGGNLIDAGAEFLGFETDLGPGQWTSFRDLLGGSIQTALGPLAAANEISGSALDFVGNVGAWIAGDDDDDGGEITDEELAGTAEVDDRDDDGGGDGEGSWWDRIRDAAANAVDAARDAAAEASREAREREADERSAALEDAPEEEGAGGASPASATVDLGVTYTISGGDTLGVLADEVAALLPPPPPPVWGPGGLVEVLAQSNAITDANLIFTGSPLVIPTEEELQELYG